MLPTGHAGHPAGPGTAARTGDSGGGVRIRCADETGWRMADLVKSEWNPVTMAEEQGTGDRS